MAPLAITTTASDELVVSFIRLLGQSRYVRRLSGCVLSANFPRLAMYLVDFGIRIVGQ